LLCQFADIRRSRIWYVVRYYEENEFQNAELTTVEHKKWSPVKKERLLSSEKCTEYVEVCKANSFGKYGYYFDVGYRELTSPHEEHKIGGNTCFVNMGFTLHDSKDYSLLLQITDGDDFSIADGGAMFFVIPKEALKNKEFDKTEFYYDSL
jgi:uncharacterized protein YwqG